MTAQPRTARSIRRPLLLGLIALLATVNGPAAQADPLYNITDLGTFPGYNSSVATDINNQGQIVGYSFNYGTSQTASFLYSNGQLTSINPTGGGASVLNDLGQVLGGAIGINDSGQAVYANTAINSSGQSVPLGPYGATPVGDLAPYAINNAGEIAGSVEVPSTQPPIEMWHPAILMGGKIIDLFSLFPAPANSPGTAYAINQNGDVLYEVNVAGSSQHALFYLYHAGTGQETLLQGINPLGLNDKDQVVGGGMLYTKGTYQNLLSLLPPSSGWSDLNANAINHAGQIVGMGNYDGQNVAFLMTPEATSAPEPGDLAVWATVILVAACYTWKKGIGSSRNPTLRPAV